eukprot:gb/GECG01009955.1/.p1 GENE.gb/GECG01009955.1/~~gb/GECG01009955.1/.p1  ORF type:complete len:110 (+),score=7.59 gb/GECG01009955.1/:1-330(+)
MPAEANAQLREEPEFPIEWSSTHTRKFGRQLPQFLQTFYKLAMSRLSTKLLYCAPFQRKWASRSKRPHGPSYGGDLHNWFQWFPVCCDKENTSIQTNKQEEVFSTAGGG